MPLSPETTISVELNKEEIDILARLLNNRVNAGGGNDPQILRLFNKIERLDLEIHRKIAK